MSFNRGSGQPPQPRPELERIVRADEREHIARELHDSTSQLLVLLNLQLGRLRRSSATNVEPLIQECEKTISEIRECIRRLHLD